MGGLFEQVTKPTGVIEYKHYILAGNKAIAIRTLLTNNANDTRYLHKDHLGGLDAITDESGNLLEKLSYDAFGKRRSETVWTQPPSSTDWTNIAAITHRGFTFHEQLDDVGLVHMNGRVYDPTIGRFISADPTVQNVFMSQSLNRYTYVLNNPLSMVDPTGYSWLSDVFSDIGHFFSKFWRPIVAIVAAVLTYGIALYFGVPASAGAFLAGFVAGAVNGGFAGALVGGAVGAFTFGIGDAFSSMADPLICGGLTALGSGLVGGVAAGALGGKFSMGFRFAFGASAAYSYYHYVTEGYAPTWSRGGDVVSKDPNADDYEPANPAWDNVGVATPNPEGANTGWWRFIPRYEGNWLLRLLNDIPGFNSFATFHDWLMESISPGWFEEVINLPSMVPAIALNYASLLNGTPAFVIANRNDPR